MGPCKKILMNRDKMKYSYIDQDDAKEIKEIILAYKGAKKFLQEIKPILC